MAGDTPAQRRDWLLRLVPGGARAACGLHDKTCQTAAQAVRALGVLPAGRIARERSPSREYGVVASAAPGIDPEVRNDDTERASVLRAQPAP